MGRSKKTKDLPPEVLENVLARLPLHALCRFRLVCKAWNHLISQPSFASLRTLMPRTASSVLISPKLQEDTGMDRTPSTEWNVLDAVEKRSYELTDSFITGLDSLFWLPGWSKYTLAADGGLIYTVYSASWNTFTRGKPRVHIVCNPVSKSYHEIPERELHCQYNRGIVVMSVDNVTKSYKIITMESYQDVVKTGRQEVYLYESTTSVWRKLCEVPGDGYGAYSSIVMNGVLYTLFEKFSNYGPIGLCPMLYSCDLATGVWRKVDVDLPPPTSDRQNKLLLVVSLNRLFMVRYTGLEQGRKKLVTLSIWEIFLAKKEVVQVAELRKFSKYSKKTLQIVQELTGEAVVAVGCADSIVISSVMGQRVKFDLLKKRWHKLPADNGHGPHCRGICAGIVDF